MKKFLLIGLLLIVVSFMAGCGGGGGSSDNNANTAEISPLFDEFAAAVDSYTVDGGSGMLDCLTGSDFTLEIKESGLDYSKTYDLLQSELEDDEDNQLKWRKTKTDGGYGYQLELKLATPSFSNVSSTGAIAVQNFEVYESADEIARMKTDQGNITWQVAKIGGVWKASHMTIEYGTLAASVMYSSSAKVKAGGFGFSTFDSRFPR